MTRGWWRRNALALGAVVVLAPVTAAAISINAWQDLPALNTRAVAAGEVVAFAGAQIGPVAAEFGRPGGTPSSARVVAVDVRIDPKDAALTCLSPELVEVSDPHRRWRTAEYELDRPYDPDRVTYCDAALTEPYTLSLDYIVPSDAAGPFSLEFVSFEADGERLLLATGR